jgi:hypothetical protein
VQSAVARKNGREPEGPVGKGRDDFFLIFLFTFLIKQKSKCQSGMRTYINEWHLYYLKIVANVYYEIQCIKKI